MIRSLLVPFDGSPSSISALSIACSLAGIVEAKVTGLYVEDENRFIDVSLASAIAENVAGAPIIPQPLPPSEMLEAEEEVAQEGTMLANEFQRVCEDSEVHGVFLRERGNPGEVVTRRAKTVDYVVIGNAGLHAGHEGLPAGTTVEHLLRSTTRPVLVVPDEAVGESSMIIAYDGSRASERALVAGAELAVVCDIETVHLLSVGFADSEVQELQAAAREYLLGYGLEVLTSSRDGKPADAINQYASSVDASVVVLGAFGSNRISELVFGSTTKQLIELLSDSAILLVP